MDTKTSGALSGLTIVDRSLSETAATIIRKKIIGGELEPGMKLSEAGFAEALGISRACIRAAFQTLCGEGLLRKAANRYTKVVTLAQEDIEEILQLRAAIEGCCYETAVEKRALDMDELEKRALSTYPARTAKDMELQWIEPDFAFHGAIVESSGNRRAIAAWRQLRNQAMLALHTAFRESAAPIPIDNHLSLVNDLRTLPPAEGAARLRRHVLTGLVDIGRTQP